MFNIAQSNLLMEPIARLLIVYPSTKNFGKALQQRMRENFSTNFVETSAQIALVPIKLVGKPCGKLPIGSSNSKYIALRASGPTSIFPQHFADWENMSYMSFY